MEPVFVGIAKELEKDDLLEISIKELLLKQLAVSIAPSGNEVKDVATTGND